MSNGNGYFQTGDIVDVSEQYPFYRNAKNAKVLADSTVRDHIEEVDTSEDWHSGKPDFTKYLYVFFKGFDSGRPHYMAVKLEDLVAMNGPKVVEDTCTCHMTTPTKPEGAVWVVENPNSFEVYSLSNPLDAEVWLPEGAEIFFSEDEAWDFVEQVAIQQVIEEVQAMRRK